MESRLKTGCPACGQKLNVGEELLGRKVKCPSCTHRWILESVGFSSGRTLETRADVLQGNDESFESTDTNRRPTDRGKYQPDETLDRIGRFELKEILGGGGFGVVYRAFDPTLGRMVALKVPKFGPEEETKSRRFLTEAHAAASLHHPNIVAVYESGKEGDRLYIVSEFVEGEVLSARIREKPENFREAALWVRALADGLSLAHAEGIVHRDIKPANIMLGPKDRPMIMDFGLARLTHEDSQVTGDGSLLGTPAYMSPEQARGEVDNVGPLSDQYSLGVVLYELLTGRRPFDGPPHAVIAQVVSADPPEPHKLNRNIPPDLAAICTKAMEKDSEKRYADLNEMAEDLSRWISGRETFARPLSLWEKGRRWYAKNPTVGRLWLAVGGLMSILVVAASFDYARTKFVVTKQEKSIEPVEKARIDAQRTLAINEFERGRKYCESGEIDHGLLWLASSLQKLTPEQRDLEAPIRSYIGSWLPRIHRLRTVLKLDKSVNTAAISPDGKDLLVGSGEIQGLIPSNGPVRDFREFGPGELSRWDLKTGKSLGETIVCEGAVTAVDYSPDGAIVACGSLDHKLRILDGKTFKEIREPVVHPLGITCQSFSHNGKYLATGCLDEYVRIWDTRTWELVGTPFHHPPIRPGERYWSGNPFPWILQVGFSPDDQKLLVSVFLHKPPSHQNVSIWDISKHALIHDPAHSTIRLDGFTSDGAEVGVVDGNDRLQLKNVNDLNQVTLPVSEKVDCWKIHVNRASGFFLSAGTSNSGMVIDLSRGLRIGQYLRHGIRVNSVFVSNDAKTLVTSSRDGEVRIWETARSRPYQSVISHNRVGTAQFLPDGRTLITADERWARPEDAVAGEPGTVERFWDAESLQLIHGPYLRHAASDCHAFTKDGELYARGMWNSITIYKVRDGSTVMESQALPSGTKAVAFISNDSILVTGGEDGMLRYWDYSAGKMVGEPIPIVTTAVTAMKVSPNERYLAVGSNSGELKLWDLQTRTVVSEPIKLSRSVSSIAFHPEGKLAATACHDNSVHIWNVPNGTPHGAPLVNINRDEHWVNAVAFRPNGRELMVAGGNRGVGFWDLETRLPVSLSFTIQNYLHKADLNSTGDRILAWGYDEKSHIDAEVITVPPPLDGDPETVNSLIERSLGMRIHEDGSLRILTREEFNARSGIPR